VSKGEEKLLSVLSLSQSEGAPMVNLVRRGSHGEAKYEERERQRVAHGVSQERAMRMQTEDTQSGSQTQGTGEQQTVTSFVQYHARTVLCNWTK